MVDKDDNNPPLRRSSFFAVSPLRYGPVGWASMAASPSSWSPKCSLCASRSFGASPRIGRFPNRAEESNENSGGASKPCEKLCSAMRHMLRQPSDQLQIRCGACGHHVKPRCGPFGCLERLARAIRDLLYLLGVHLMNARLLTCLISLYWMRPAYLPYLPVALYEKFKRAVCLKQEEICDRAKAKISPDETADPEEGSTNVFEGCCNRTCSYATILACEIALVFINIVDSIVCITITLAETCRWYVPNFLKLELFSYFCAPTDNNALALVGCRRYIAKGGLEGFQGDTRELAFTKAFLSPYSRFIADAAAYHKAFSHQIIESLAARFNYGDRMVHNALLNGTRQIVILGAGYDTRAYRFAELRSGAKLLHDANLLNSGAEVSENFGSRSSSIDDNSAESINFANPGATRFAEYPFVQRHCANPARVIEIDKPTVQCKKLQQLRAAFTVPQLARLCRDVEYVHCDFNSTPTAVFDLLTRLGSSKLDPNENILYVLEGVSEYLTKDQLGTTFANLRRFRGLAAGNEPRHRIIFTAFTGQDLADKMTLFERVICLATGVLTSTTFPADLCDLTTELYKRYGIQVLHKRNCVQLVAEMLGLDADARDYENAVKEFCARAMPAQREMLLSRRKNMFSFIYAELPPLTPLKPET